MQEREDQDLTPRKSVLKHLRSIDRAIKAEALARRLRWFRYDEVDSTLTRANLSARRGVRTNDMLRVLEALKAEGLVEKKISAAGTKWRAKEE